MSIEIIAEELKDSYTYIVCPKGMIDTPVELAKMLKEDGVSYYTLNEIHDALGNQFTFTPSIDERFVKFRWNINMNGVDKLLSDYLLTKGLVDMRDNGIVGLNYEVNEIDFTVLNGNEFGIFSMVEIKQVPNVPDTTAII